MPRKIISTHCGALYTASSGHGRSPGGWGQRGTCEMQDIPTVAAAADACNYDSDNAKIMFQSRTHNLEFQLIGEKPENSNIYVVYMQFFFSCQNPAC